MFQDVVLDIINFGFRPIFKSNQNYFKMNPIQLIINITYNLLLVYTKMLASFITLLLRQNGYIKGIGARLVTCQFSTSKGKKQGEAVGSGGNLTKQQSKKESNQDIENPILLMIKLQQNMQKLEWQRLKLEQEKLIREQQQKEAKLKRQQQQKEQRRKSEEAKLKREQQQKEQRRKFEEAKLKREQQQKEAKLKSENKKFWLAFLSLLMLSTGSFVALDQYLKINVLRRIYKQFQYLAGLNLKNCLKELKKEVPTQFSANRDQIDQKAISQKNYKIHQIFYQTSVSKQIQSVLKQLSKDLKKMTVLYGLPGIGKSSAIRKQVNKRKEKGDLIAYLHTRQLDGSRTSQNQKEHSKGNVKIGLIQKHPIIQQIYQIVKNANNQIGFGKDEKKQIQDKIKSQQGITIIIDEFNAIQEEFDIQKYSFLMGKLLQLQQKGVKILLISSNRSFCAKKLVSASCIRSDKFNLIQIKSNKRKDFDQMFIDFKFSQQAKQMILNLHFNRRDMFQAIGSYLNYKGSEQGKLSSLKAQLKEDLHQKLYDIKTLIDYNKGNYEEYLESICIAQTPSKIKKPTEGVAKLLCDYNIVDSREFTSKIQMKAFEQYAKFYMGKKQPYKCKSQKFYYSP